ncbi:MAG: sulfatase-like hydrolase/transferase, partial [Pseudomonadota bacterium]
MSRSPDIIFIITDQQRYDTINALGASHMDTPNIDRLVKNGVSFEQCHVTAPSCVPCRASLFTGYYPHTNGVLANGQPWSRTWVSDLADAGYHCVNIGKMHTIPYDAKAGFHERFVVENKDRYLEGRWFFDEWDKALASRGLRKQQREDYRKRPDYKDRLGAFTWDLEPELQSDNFIGDTVCWWLKTKPVEKPLFMTIGFPGPHPPYDPTPDLAEKYMARDVPLPEVSAEELEDLVKPWVIKRDHDVEVDHDSVSWKLDPTRDELHRMRAYYYANVEMIDTQVGRILDALEVRGNLDNTIIIFTSDHGDNLGDHGLVQKWAPYEEVTRVPLTIFAPGRFPGARRVNALVQLFDLGPTILEWAGVAPDPTFEAISLNPALEAQDFEGRDHVFCEQAGDVNMTGASYLTMIRSRTHKLVHFRGNDE